MNFIYANGGFYSLDNRPRFEAAGAWPAGGVEITEQERDALIAGERAGKAISPDADGRPVLIDPPPPIVTAPQTVSPAQARLALLAAGKLAQVETIVAGADQATQIAWNNASVIERTSPTVAALAGALGLTDAQLDDLFTTAAGIFV